MRPARRTVLVLLSAAIAAVLTVLLPVTAAPAATLSAAGTRVGASPAEMILPVGASHTLSPGQGRCEAALQAWFAAGACAAAEDAGAAGADDATTPLYRVSPAARGSSELDNGLDPANFPRTEELDGAARFGNEARVQDFAANNEGYGVGFRVDVPSSWLSANGIEAITGMTEDQLEYAIPRELFDEFNQFLRSPWSPGK